MGATHSFPRCPVCTNVKNKSMCLRCGSLEPESNIARYNGICKNCYLRQIIVS